MSITKLDLTQALDNIPNPVSIQDKEFTIQYENKARQDFIGKSNVGEKCYSAYRNLDSICEDCLLIHILGGNKVQATGIQETKDQEGNTKYFEITASPIRDKDGKVIYGLEIAKDVTENVLLQRRLEEESVKDPLTGLFNRRGLSYRLDDQKELSKRHSHDLSTIFLDIDNFGPYNKSYGHDQGDRALVNFSNILRDIARKGDVYGRRGGEEFLLVLPETNLENAKIVAERLRRAVEETKIPLVKNLKQSKITYPLHNPEKITISSGIASYPEISPLGMLVDESDKAMRDAKEQGKNKVCVYC